MAKKPDADDINGSVIVRLTTAVRLTVTLIVTVTVIVTVGNSTVYVCLCV